MGLFGTLFKYVNTLAQLIAYDMYKILHIISAQHQHNRFVE